MRFFRNSSLTGSNLYPLSRNSPIVRVRVVIDIQFCVTFLVAWIHGMHVRQRGQTTNPTCSYCTINVWNQLDSTASSKKTQERSMADQQSPQKSLSDKLQARKRKSSQWKRVLMFLPNRNINICPNHRF